MDITIRNGIILDNLLPYLNASSLIKCCTICKEWYYLISNNERLWKRVCQFEGIDPDDWKWHQDDEEQRILDQPCKWKQYILMYKRTAKNLQINNYKRYDFKIICLYADYDGKTLVLGNREILKIYKIINFNNLEFLQNLQIQNNNIHDAKTNTDYIVLQLNKSLCIYRFVENRYEFDYKICSNRVGDIIFVNEFIENFSSFLYINQFYFWGKSLCFDVYVHPHDAIDYYRLYGWDVINKKPLLNLNNHLYLEYDKQYLYVTNKDRNSLLLYNKKFEKVISINLEYRLFKIFTNNELLNVWHVDVESKSWISTWCKSTGEMLTSLRKLNYHFADAITLVYPEKNFFIVFDCSHRLIVYRLSDLYKLWEIRLHCETFNQMKNYRLWDPKIFYKFRKIFAIVRAVGMYTNESINSDTFLNVYNVFNGDILFTINLGNTSLMLTPFVFNDMIICFRQCDVTSIYLYR